MLTTMANLLNVGFLTLATTLVLWLYSIPGAIKSEAELQRKLPISFIQQLQQVLAPVLGEDRLDKPPTEVPTPQSTGKAPSVLQQILAPLLSPFALSPPVSPPPTSDSTVVPQREVRPFNAWGTRDADGSVHFGPWAHEDEAYVLLMSNDKYIHLLWALEGSFRNVSSTRRRIVMCTPAVSVEMKMILERIGMDVRNIEQPRHNNFKVQFSNWNDTLAKLALFDLPGVTKVVYLDLDTLINHNLDYMFDRDMNAKVYAMSDVIDCSNNITHMNAGLLATLTNKTLKAELMNQLEDPNFFKERKGDQEMLDVYLQKHGMLVMEPETTMSFYIRCTCLVAHRITPYSLDDLKIVHFTSWFINPIQLLTTGVGFTTEPCGRRWFARWTDMYHQMTDSWHKLYPNLGWPALLNVKGGNQGTHRIH